LKRPRRKARLEAIVRRPSFPQALVRRAQIVLLAHQGRANAQIAAELGCSVTTVRAWRHRFARGGIPALSDRPRCGRPQVYGPDVRLAIVATATSAPPEATTVWTHEMIAAHLAGTGTGISPSQVGRILAGLDLAWVAAHPPGHRHLHTQTRLLAGHGRVWFSTLARGLLWCGEFTSRAGLAGKITSFAVR
jgi:transposase